MLTPGSHVPTLNSTFPTCRRETLPPTCQVSRKTTCLWWVYNTWEMSGAVHPVS